MRVLKAAALIVIVCWGIREASHILLVVLISLFLAYVAVPFPRWLIKRFKLRKPIAISLTVTSVVLIYVLFSVFLFEASLRIIAKMPIYEAHFNALYQQVTIFINSHGSHLPTAPPVGYLEADRVTEFAIATLPRIVGLFSERLLVWLLSLLFLIEIVEAEESKLGPLSRGLIHYGGDVQRFIAIQAKTGALTALVNLALLVVLGVEVPILWCVLYFFLQFIPTLGFVIAMVPPTLIALLTFGWTRALLAAGGLVLTQMLSDYLIQPMFMKKGLHVALIEIILSLVIWGYLLGPWGGILAVPLTLVLRKFIQESSKERAPI